MKIRILLVDDQTIVRQGLKMYLSLDPDLEIIGEANNGLEAVQLADTLKPDLILMDLFMPQMNGVEAIREIRKLGLDYPIAALSQSQNPHLIAEVLQIGANAFLSKDIHSENLVHVIKHLLDKSTSAS